MNKDNYRKINDPINSDLYSVQNMEYKWGVVDENDKVIVEFGKYSWIDGFRNGLAKVIGHNDTTSPRHVCSLKFNKEKDDLEIDYSRKAAQGIINESGEEVLPLEYNIWKFYGKDFPSIKAFKGDMEYKFSFEQLNPELDVDSDDERDYYNDYYDDTPSYRELMEDTWDAMTDGQYGDMPEGFDGDFDFLGY